jgi:hypothetical protein
LKYHVVISNANELQPPFPPYLSPFFKYESREFDNKNSTATIIMEELYETATCKKTVQAWQPAVFAKMLNNWLPIGTIVVLSNSKVVRIIRYAVEPRCRPTTEAPNVLLIGDLFETPLHQQPFALPMSPLLRGIRDRELIVTSKQVQFRSEDIDDLAFLFTDTCLVKKGYVIQGMANCWFVRFDCNMQSVAGTGIFRSFASGYKDLGFRGYTDTPRNIWLSIVLLQQQFRGVMSRYGAKCQGDFHTVGKIKVPFTIEAYGYLVYRLRCSNRAITNQKEKKK